MKYEYTNKMREISGFGGGYEEACRKMVVAGLEWWNNHSDADVSYKEFKNIYGITTEESEDCKALIDVMCKSIDGGPSGAMVQACLGHVMYAHKNGWDKYVEEMGK